jgi:LysM domain
MTTTHATRPVPAPLHEGARPTHLRLVRAGDTVHVRATLRRSTAIEPPLRLTRRGRAVLRALVLLLLVALLSTAGLALARRADAADPLAPVRYHVVLPGETLWGIATRLDPSADPRETIAELVETNHLPSAAVGAGQRLILPPGLPRQP